MNEVRSGRPIMSFAEARFQPEADKSNSPKKSGWKYVGMIVLGLLILALGFIFVDKIFLNSGEANVLGALVASDDYQAVFLLNGQVYFGKMISSNDKQIILQEVYYLQTSGMASSTEKKKYDLVKLGSEAYGPTSEVVITRSNVLFYETLRADSQVVQSIKNYK